MSAETCFDQAAEFFRRVLASKLVQSTSGTVIYPLRIVFTSGFYIEGLVGGTIAVISLSDLLDDWRLEPREDGAS